MTDPELEKRIRNVVRVTQLVSFAFIIFVVILLGLAWYQKSMLQSSKLAESSPQLLFALGLQALLLLIFAPTVQKLLLRIGGKDKLSIPIAIARFNLATIVGGSLREAAAILGFICTFLSGEFNWVLGLGALAIASMVLAFPKESDLRALISKLP